MKLCKINHDGAYVPISDHKSDGDCRREAKKLGDGDYVAIRINTPFRVKTKTVKKATVENIPATKEERQ